jgi:uncharacterized membrane protein YqiK
MMSETQLATIVSESGLDESKAEVLLANFSDYFKIAAEWERKAKALQVTDESQVAEMKMAREGRLFLKEKRVAVEKTRKALKEQSVREGKAIDGIANVLKALIVPIEEYLGEQEHFVKLQEEARQEAMRQEVEARIERERIEAEKQEAQEREQQRLENIRLREEAEARAKEAETEREKAEAEKKQAVAEAEAERNRMEAEAKEAQAKANAALEAERAEKVRMQERLTKQVECPFCHRKFSVGGEQQ